MNYINCGICNRIIYFYSSDRSLECKKCMYTFTSWWLPNTIVKSTLKGLVSELYYVSDWSGIKANYDSISLEDYWKMRKKLKAFM